MKTSLRAAIAGVSVIVFLGDDYQHYSCGSHDFFEPLLNELVSGCSSCQSSSNDVNPVVKKMHHIKVKCQNVVLELEVLFDILYL